jgi:hypothetical protein
MKAREGNAASSETSLPRHKMEVKVKVEAQAPSIPGKGPSVEIE